MQPGARQSGKHLHAASVLKDSHATWGTTEPITQEAGYDSYHELEATNDKAQGSQDCETVGCSPSPSAYGKRASAGALTHMHIRIPHLVAFFGIT
eukprot:513283-Pelagomonas_calceolata.AAC.3